MASLRVGTRGSTLALTQTRMVCNLLSEIIPDATISEVEITSEGDTNTEPLSSSKTPGVFVSALRDQLLAGSVDFIVHSMKDLPAAAHPGIVLAGVPAREDIRDVLVSTHGQSLRDLAPGSLIGTSSPRREASIRRLRPDMTISSIRGNVPTRIEKVRSGEYDATILALAGITRLGLADVATEILPLEDFLPAPRQGALAIECRVEDASLVETLGALDEPVVRMATSAEQGVLLGLDAGCATAVSAVAQWHSSTLSIIAELAVASTGEVARVSRSFRVHEGDHSGAVDAGRRVADDLLASAVSERADLS
jgi:hydroxymethylbilane synthase